MDLFPKLHELEHALVRLVRKVLLPELEHGLVGIAVLIDARCDASCWRAVHAPCNVRFGRSTLQAAYKCA